MRNLIERAQTIGLLILMAIAIGIIVAIVWAQVGPVIAIMFGILLIVVYLGVVADAIEGL